MAFKKTCKIFPLWMICLFSMFSNLSTSAGKYLKYTQYNSGYFSNIYTSNIGSSLYLMLLYSIVGKFHGVLILVTFMVDLAVNKFSTNTKN